MNNVGEQEKAQGLKLMLVNMLQEVQDDCGVQVVITEGVPPDTTGSHEKDSEHFTGEGADVRVKGGQERMKIVKSAMKIGFKRIGVYNAHVHLGTSITLPQDVIWGGVSK